MKKHLLSVMVAFSAVSAFAAHSHAGGCPNNCSGNGVCDTNTNFCTCNAGWIGVDCSIPVCPGSCGNGVCVSPGVCNCFAGWTGPNCDVPSCPGNCNNNGTCVSPNSCVCDTGYAGPNCEFCAPNYYNYPVCTYCEASVTCSGNGTCSVTGTCICNSGYSGFNCENGPPPVPTVSEWGLAILVLTGLVAGSVLFQRRSTMS